MTAVLTRDEVLEALSAHRAAGRRIVFTNGAFDLLHVGHVRCLAAAAALGDVLVVGINADDAVRRAKGAGRPVQSSDERAEIVAAIQGVDLVLVFDEPTVDPLLEQLRPDIHAKGRDYDAASLPERATCERLGIEMAFVGDQKHHSTSATVQRLEAGAPANDNVVPYEGHAEVRGYTTRAARRWLARAGANEIAFWFGEEGDLVHERSNRSVRRVELSGRTVYAKLTRPFDARRHPVLEFQHHLALRACGFGAAEPVLAVEGKHEGQRFGLLVTAAADGIALEAWLARHRDGSPRRWLAAATGIGRYVRALHTARFLPQDLTTWHMFVPQDWNGDARRIELIDLMRLDRGRALLRKRPAVKSLAPLAASLGQDADERFRLRALQSYLGGTLRAARPWLRAIREREAHLLSRGTLKRRAPPEAGS